MADFSEFDREFGPDEDLFPNRWRNNGPPRDGYYPPSGGGGGSRLKHVKNGGSSVAAFNEGTGQMSSSTVTEYTCSSTGLLTSSANTLTAYNPGGQIAANAYGVVALNEAGLWVWVVVKCV